MMRRRIPSLFNNINVVSYLRLRYIDRLDKSEANTSSCFCTSFIFNGRYDSSRVGTGFTGKWNRLCMVNDYDITCMQHVSTINFTSFNKGRWKGERKT